MTGSGLRRVEGPGPFKRERATPEAEGLSGLADQSVIRDAAGLQNVDHGIFHGRRAADVKGTVPVVDCSVSGRNCLPIPIYNMAPRVEMCVQPRAYDNELTYLTHKQDDAEEQFHQAYEEAVESVRADLGDVHPLKIDGEAVETGDTFTVTSPGDHDLEIGTFAAETASFLTR